MMTSRFGRGCKTRIFDSAGKRYIHNDLGLHVPGPDSSAIGGDSKDSPVHETSRTEGSTTSIEDRFTSCPSVYELRTPASTSECETQEGLLTDFYADPIDQCVAEPDQLDGPLRGNTSVAVYKKASLATPAWPRIRLRCVLDC